MIEPSMQERQCDNPPLVLHVPSVNRGLGILFLCFMEKILGAWPNFKALVLLFRGKYICDEKGKCRSYNLPTHGNNFDLRLHPSYFFIIIIEFQECVQLEFINESFFLLFFRYVSSITFKLVGIFWFEILLRAYLRILVLISSLIQFNFPFYLTWFRSCLSELQHKLNYRIDC